MEISDKAKVLLLQAARNSIKSLFEDIMPAPVDSYEYPVLSETNHGAFVTLNEFDELRGCIGFIHSDRPLLETIIDAAKHAAMYDPRFPKVRKKEVQHIEIEVSVLSEPSPIEYDDIQIGKHGLILEEQGRHGLLLPQVATEHNMDIPEFLSSLCQKTGVESYLWKQKKLNLKAFTAVVFSERVMRSKGYEIT